MPCRSASLIKFSPVLTRLLNCNTAPLLLGAGQSAKGAGLYMCKYMVKDAYALAASLSVLADARKHISAYPSAAEDAGTAGRCTRHFLQRVLNAGATELAPTQAAAIVLGIPSSGHSHNFVNAYVWDAVRLLDVIRSGGALLEDATENADDASPDNVGVGTTGEAAPAAEACASDDEVDHADDTGHGRTGVAPRPPRRAAGTAPP